MTEELVLTYSDDIVVKVRHNREINVSLSSEGLRGPPGRNGDVTPDAIAARDAARAAATEAQDHLTYVELARGDVIAAKSAIDGQVGVVAGHAAAASSASTTAASAAEAADVAQVNATAAQQAAESAKTSAEGFAEAADTARINADAARADAEVAKAGSQTARNEAVLAANSATQAKSDTEALKADVEGIKSEILSIGDDVEQIATDAATSAAQADAARVGAETAAAGAIAARSDALTAADEAEDSKDQAVAAKNYAEDVRADAAEILTSVQGIEANVVTKETQASAHAGAAEGHATAASNAADAALIAQNKADAYANNDEDDPVEPGKFSARHWAAKAEAAAIDSSLLLDKATFDPNGVNADVFDRANHTGTQTLATISDAGTAAALDAGTGAGEVLVLDGSGLIPAAVLPSYVDDVIEAADFASLPSTGETGKIYVTLGDNKTWRWSGSAYVEISASPGSTDAVTEGATNLYFTAARVRAVLLTGLSTATNAAIAATDSVLVAFGKLQAQVSAAVLKLGGIEDGADVTDAANVAAAGAAMLAVERQTQSGGANIIPKNLGNLSGATIHLDCGQNPILRITNNGSGTINASPTGYGVALIELLNAANAGAVTHVGFTIVENADILTTASADKFIGHLYITANVKRLTWSKGNE